MKRTLSAILAVLLISTILVACQPQGNSSTAPTSATTATGSETAKAEDPFGSYEKGLKIKIGKTIDPNAKYPEGETPTDNQYTKKIKEVLNIEFENMWEVAPGNDASQKVNLAIASNDLPDMLIANETQFRAMLKAGQIEDIKTAFSTYASPVINQMFKSAGDMAIKNVSVDNKMYAIPSIKVPDDSYNLFWIRKDWLDKLSLEIPRTTEELVKIAKAFVDKDPGENGTGNTIGMVGPSNGNRLYSYFLSSNITFHGFDFIFSAKNSYPGYWVKDGSGSISYGSISKETREGLSFLAKMYADGLIDPQMGIRKDSTEPITSGQCGIMGGPWWGGYSPIPDCLNNNPEANWQAYMLEDSNGNINTHMASAADSYLVVRKGYENPEAAVKLMNLLAREEGNFDLTVTGIGEYPLRVPLAMYDESSVTREAIISVLNNETKLEDYSGVQYDPYKLLKSDLQAAAKIKLPPFDNNDIKYWNRNGDSANFPRLYSLLVGQNPIYSQKINEVYSVTYGQTKTMETKWANLLKIEDETFLKIIMGSEPIEAFDTFVEQWKVQGGDQITQEINLDFK